MSRYVPLLAFLFTCCKTLNAASPELRAGSIGVVYVTGQTATEVALKIVFPAEAINHYPPSFPSIQQYWKASLPLSYREKIIIFDERGSLLPIDEPVLFKLVFWCENDGGDQYRPEARTRVDKSRFQRQLKPIPAIQSAAGFAIIAGSMKEAENKAEQVALQTADPDIRMIGKLRQSGSAVAILTAEVDPAGNCDNEPPNNLNVNLHTAAGEFCMRCCGP